METLNPLVREALDTITKGLAEELRKQKTKRQWTIRQMAEFLNLTPYKVTQALQGKFNGTYSHLLDLCLPLGIAPIVWLDKQSKPEYEAEVTFSFRQQTRDVEYKFNQQTPAMSRKIDLPVVFDCVYEKSYSELDFELKNHLGFDYEQHELIEIEKRKPHWEPEGEYISVEELRQTVEAMEKAGATHARLEAHTDHNGYEFAAYIVRVATNEENEERERVEHEQEAARLQKKLARNEREKAVLEKKLAKNNK